MANRIRTIDFLPEIFRTETNKQFLSSTLDQLVQEPKLKPTQGYIGRRVGPGVNPNDNYVIEPTVERANYQLEPGLTFLASDQNKVTDVLTYPGYIDRLRIKGANVDRHDRLFNSEYYSWDPFVDFDKFVNFGQYYWLPAGPDSVDVSASEIPLTDDFTVTRARNGYTFSDYTGTLPTITLVREGNYTFDVNQTGNPFWIQSVPGTDGTLDHNDQSSREVLGVINNGEDLGTITFNVPAKNAQNFYYELTNAGTVDLVTDLKFNQINNITLSAFLAEHTNIDGIDDLDGRTIIFTNTVPGEDGGWIKTTRFDNVQGFDGEEYDKTTEITSDSEKYSIWQITYVYDNDNPSDPIITLSTTTTVANLSKLTVNYGSLYGNTQFYKSTEGYYEKVPLLTANVDTLYYQDANNANFFGVIKLIDQESSDVLDVNEILASSTYTSPNGVVFTNGLKVQFEGTTDPATYSGNEYYVEGVGTQIQLIPVTDLITPESYTQSLTTPFDSTRFDTLGFDETENAPINKDYIVINRASPDLNPWARVNRWFHIDVINATATYNNTTPIIDNDNRANRPIIEFRAGLRLFNWGTQSVANIDVIDTFQTDAFSNVNGAIGYGADGVDLVDGTKVIFANDTDTTVRNKIYTVKMEQFDDSSDEVITLIDPISISLDQTVIVKSGTSFGGKSFYFDGTSWEQTQQKTSLNQAPLFDIFDGNGISFSDTTVYPSSTFTGTKLFGYALGTGTDDVVIGQPLKYLNINNVGDIVFENYINTDTFNYVNDGIRTTKSVITGYAREYSDRTTYTSRIGWQTANNEIVSAQSFSFEYDGTDLILDVEVDSTVDVPVKLYVNGEFYLPSKYTYTTNSNGVTQITFTTAPTVGSLVEVVVTSDTASQIAYYTVPSNLENNSVNEINEEITLGTIRNHYNTICQNHDNFTGEINGANNVRDLGNTIPYGRNVVQQSSPMTLLGTFLNDTRFDFFKSLEFAASEYEKFKNRLMDEVTKSDWTGKTTDQILDSILETLNAGKNEISPFYWGDMIPSGRTFDETTYTVSNITSNTFDTLYSYDFTSSNYTGILVYLNDVLLTADDHEYTVASDGPRITINPNEVTLANGDIIKIREFTTTYGSYVPATPTKLGLSPAYRPQKFSDDTYVTESNVIRGHDGSLTVAFNDLRDDVLLEFEKRVYNNLKLDDQYNPPIALVDVKPGLSRTTEYALSEINEILGVDFLRWVGTNKLPYHEQTYDANNPFTWNYSRSENKITGQVLQGGWRAIYQDLYDTDSPHTRPWEMLGLTEKPSWWENRYGPAPYTSGNLVLWNDLRDGKLVTPTSTTILSDYVRPRLLEYIPTDSEGNLLSPRDTIVGNYDSNSFRKSWVLGDIGPVETAWRRSSSYQFAVQRLLALTKPAKYFSLFIDRDDYNFNTEFSQFLVNNRSRITPETVSIYGNGTSATSYINWIVDYNRVLGFDSTTILADRLSNIDIRLCYRMASFSDKQYLKIFSEKSSPNSVNNSLLIPDESYQLLLYKNPAFEELTYSSIIIQRTADGYAVFGYSTVNPYFEILSSIPTGRYSTFTVNNNQYRIPKDFRSTVARVPYGYTFTSKASVVDFLISYGELLQQRGMTFDNVENNFVMNWNQMAQEFVHWADEEWTVGSLINLNPGADLIKITKENAIAENLIAPGAENVILDQNKKAINIVDFVIERLDNDLTLRALNNTNFNLLNTRFTAYEHIIVLDNTSIFSDLLYDPSTGSRQGRLLVNGYKTFDWNGTLDAQGFILNQDNVQDWEANRAYSKGELVIYKNSYWSASELIPPAETFDFSVWIESDYELIQKGLLPNIATKSDLIRNHYDTYSANLERDADLMGFGLIGFRPRQYMQDLNLDDISQVNLYKQFLGSKGTLQSAETFSLANLNKEVAEYEITENWAIQRAKYGATSNRSYFELRLLEESLFSNPSTISVIEPQSDNGANQTVVIDDIWKESYKITNTNILPTLTIGRPDRVLPSAGYVNYDDVDIKIFDFNDLTTIVNNIELIRTGTTIWVAKSNAYDWNVYETSIVPSALIQVTDNLNETCTVTFKESHNLVIGDKLIIKNFDSDVDGVYEVVTVPGLKTATINHSLTGTATSITGQGVGFVLASVRVSQSSDIADLGLANRLTIGSKVWADDDGNGSWKAYKKIHPFSQVSTLEPTYTPGETDDDNEQNLLFGTSVVIGVDGWGGMIGAPGHNSNKGGVYTYNRSGEATCVQNSVLAPETTDIVGFGTSLSSGLIEYGVSGAPDSDSGRGYAFVTRRDQDTGDYFLTQCLYEETTSANAEFGRSVAVSEDERWMYVGAPGDNTVYAYQKIEVESQTISFTGDGSTNSFDTSSALKLTDDSTDVSFQVNVLVNNNVQNDVDFVIGTDGILSFTTIPNTGDVIKVTRKSSIFKVVSSATTLDISALVTVSDEYSFSVVLNNELLRPFVDYTIDSSTKIITFTPAVTGNLLINANTYWQLVDSFDYFEITGLSATNSSRFGASLATTTDGRQLIVGVPNDTVSGVVNAGSMIAIDRSVLRYRVTDTDSRVFNELATDGSTETITPTVKLNNRFLTPDDGNNINGEYTYTTADNGTITISDDVTLNIGDIIEIETNDFVMYQRIVPSSPTTNLNFGSAVEQCDTNCSSYISNTKDSTVVVEGGSVERWINTPRLYGTVTSTIANPVLTVGDKIRINNEVVTLTGTTVEDLVDDINNQNIPNITATSANGLITISLENVVAGDQFIKLTVLPYQGTVYTDLGINLLQLAQTIYPPRSSDYAHFGSSIYNETKSGDNVLVVGAPNGAAVKPTTYDDNETSFDSGSTNFTITLERTGVVYTFDYFESTNASAANPGKFVFGQQFYDETLGNEDLFGTSVSYCNGVLLIGTPQHDLGDSVLSRNYGQATYFYNQTRSKSWSTAYQEQDIVDVELLNSVFAYDRRDNSVSGYLDYIDPLYGKILGSARQNIDYISGLDPALYNSGSVNNTGEVWTTDRIGEVWWDTSSVRFIDYHQDDISYKARRWGQLFPGSSVDVYQWIESSVPPSQYTGDGTVYSTTSYVVGSKLEPTGEFSSKYYFWVKGLSTISTAKSKTLSVQAVAQYIENPRSSGISYVAPLSPNTLALYNCRNLINANDTILHVEFDKKRNTDNVHVEYELVGDGNQDSFLSAGLYRKFLDSFAGIDTLGNLVPDVNLSDANKYGVDFRPRQSMFKDRFLALENYLTRANSILATFPVVESKSFNLLNSEESMPISTSGEWDKSLNTYTELTYQDLRLVSAGYKYLVQSDETQSGLWTIYTVQSDKSLLLTRVQTYNTANYWSYIDWVLPGYNTAIRPIAEVDTYSELATVPNVSEGDSVKVNANSFNKYEIYQYLSSEWVRVVAENSTIAISNQIWDLTAGRYGFDDEVFDSQRWDQNPSTETRQIIQALNDEIFVGDLLPYRNELLILAFNYIMSEQIAPEWLVKTSLVDVNHKIRDLEPFAIYRQDNQDFVQEYINEVKPYHVKIKEFNLRYEGLDTFAGTLSDFDVPAYYDSTYSKFISPVLDDTEYEIITDALESHVPSTDAIWTTLPWSQWYNNYKLELESVTVTDGGSGYTTPPTVTVTGTATTAAQCVARINTAGEVIAVDVISPGEGYTTSPTITFTGGNGTGAVAYAVTAQKLTRSFDTTIKFDRYEYSSSVVNWTANTLYVVGDLVKYNNKLYTPIELEDSSIIATATFDPRYFEEVDQSTLTGVDRIIGLYQPDIQDPARELQQLIAGIDYPGVQVKGPNFNEDPGFDVGNFDIAPYGDPADGDLPAGSSRISDTYLDTIYESSFTDSFLGTRTSDINVDGGDFVDLYSSHAPEELVPGKTYDSLQIRVYDSDNDSFAFMIFQDMLGTQKILRMNNTINTTTLTQDVAVDDDTIYVTDASKLEEPDLENGVFGAVMINGERITYRTRNTSNNTISGLRRGVAGTGASAHSEDDVVTNVNASQQLPVAYQNYIESQTFTTDISSSFTADNITLGAEGGIDTTPYDADSFDPSQDGSAVRVEVGGTEVWRTGFLVEVDGTTPTVTLLDDVPSGAHVKIYITQSLVMYDPPYNTFEDDASSLMSLEYQTTDAAKFIRGEI